MSRFLAPFLTVAAIALLAGLYLGFAWESYMQSGVR